MTATATEDLRMLTEAVRDAVAVVSPRPYFSPTDSGGRDEGLWEVLARQIGLAGLLVPEDLGGAGAGVAETAAVLTELGSHLSPVPALATLGMAAPLSAVVRGTPAAAELAGRLADGIPATVAWPHPDGTDLTPRLEVEESPNGPVLRGETDFVLDGMAARIVLAPVAVGEAVVLVAVDTESTGVVRTPMTALDLTRGMARIVFDRAPITVLTEPAVSAEFLMPALDITLTCLAAEQVGVAARCHTDAVEWARERIQFDRPIGSFQSIKHLLVDLLMDLELSRSALDVAIRAADGYLDEPNERTITALRTAASAAKAMCGDAAMRITDESLHIFGGIGFTWEHDAHLYFRRAKTLDLLLGAPADHRRRLAATLGVGSDVTQRSE